MMLTNSLLYTAFWPVESGQEHNLCADILLSLCQEWGLHWLDKMDGKVSIRSF